MRAKWKGIWLSSKVKLAKNNYIYARNSTVVNHFVGKRVYVHTGKSFFSFLVRPLMVGHKFGEFAVTKRLGSLIHENIKKKKSKK